MAIRLVRADDWVALYVDGKMIMQPHSFRATDLLKACGVEVKQRWVDEEWAEDVGHFPDDIENVEFEEGSEWES